MSAHTSHTPGPWRLGGPVDRSVIGPDGMVIMSQMRPIAERDANARLIAMAPRMYKAIQYMAGHLCEHHQCYHEHSPEQCPFCEARAIVREIER
jgi:hypothetical protein